MPHVIELKGGRLITPFSFEDVLEEIGDVMGDDVRQYIEEWKGDIEEELEDNRYDCEEAEKELDQLQDHQHSVLCDIQLETEALDEALSAERLNRKKLQEIVRRISRMLYQEL